MATDFTNPFHAEAIAIVRRLLCADDIVFPVTAPPTKALGDYSVGCFPAAKLQKKSPAILAKIVAEEFTPTEYFDSASAAGPFVNFTANKKALATLVFRRLAKPEELIPQAGAGKTVCIDYSSPNISKQLAYHHIRSTVIGHALCNIYRALGWQTVGINHLGDWGTTHGMLLAADNIWGIDEPLTIGGLNAAYVRFRSAMKEDPTLEAQGKDWFRKLENGDPAARKRWQQFRDVSWAEFARIYDMLGITFDEVKGESQYQDQIPQVLQTLKEKGLSTISQGALVVPLDHGDLDHGDLDNKVKTKDLPPLLLRKGDGATLYGTRDIAAAIYRHETYNFDRCLYVVDRGQAIHFKQVFLTLEKANWSWAKKMHHVSFGLVRLGGKKTSSRSAGGAKQKAILLKEVFAQATTRCAARVAENNPDMDDTTTQKLGQGIGVGAVVFANLSSQRDKDIDFVWEQVLSVDGDSGPYIQYNHARCAAILRKAEEVSLPEAAPEHLLQDSECELAKKLLEFGNAVERAAQTNEPHLVSRFLLDTCASFSRWYTTGSQDPSLRVLTEDKQKSAARIALVRATKQILTKGLAILGLTAPDRM